MTYDQFNTFCGSLPATTYVVQWGGWDAGEAAITFKASGLSFEILAEQPGLRPAPYLASRGLKWIQHYAKPGLPDAALKDYLRQSHHLAAQGLSKKKRARLGLS